jgi:hypothetical protein
VNPSQITRTEDYIAGLLGQETTVSMPLASVRIKGVDAEEMLALFLSYQRLGVAKRKYRLEMRLDEPRGKKIFQAFALGIR